MRALGLWATSAAIGTALWAGTALADAPPPGYPRPYPAVYPSNITYDWTGIYIGGHVGGAVTQNQWTYTDPNVPAIDFLEQSTNGFAGGAHVGIQKQWHSVVVGAEAVYMWMDQKETSGSIAFDTSLTGTAKSVFLVSGKLGVAWDNILGYAKAGYAIGDVDYRTHTTSTGALLSTSSRQEQGWTAGVGIEYAIWDHIILGVAYDYVQLSVASRVQTAVGGGPLPTTVTNAAVDTQSVTGRLSFKFGGGRPTP